MVSCFSIRLSGVWVKIEYMMKAIGHMREKKEGEKEGKAPQERDTRKSGKWQKKKRKKKEMI